MKKYYLRIQCETSEIIEVEAENKEEAKEQAVNQFNCMSDSASICEFVDSL